MLDPDTRSTILERDLLTLLERGDSRDRAFVDAIVRMQWSRTIDSGGRAELRELHGAVTAASLKDHATLRARIACGELRGAALRSLFDDVPLLARDHFVEEVLGIAYPPLEEPTLGPELMTHSPSGYDEIVHALEVTRLGPGDRFLDMGSGMGKPALLATLLSGATSSGVECNRALRDLAEAACAALGVAGAHFHEGDAREVTPEDADVVFMYLPFTGSALATVMARLVEECRRPRGPRTRFLCSGALDGHRYPELVTAGPPKSWLHVYRWR